MLVAGDVATGGSDPSATLPPPPITMGEGVLGPQHEVKGPAVENRLGLGPFVASEGRRDLDALHSQRPLHNGLHDREAWTVGVRHHAHGKFLPVLLPLHAQVERPVGLVQQRHGRVGIAVRDRCGTEAGWTLNLSMKREKDGEELAVRMVAHPHRPGLAIMQPVMEGSLTALGIEVTTTFTGDKWSEAWAVGYATMRTASSSLSFSLFVLSLFLGAEPAPFVGCYRR